MPAARRRTRPKGRRSGPPAPAPHDGRGPVAQAGRLFGIPLGLALALLLISLVPRIQTHPVLAQSFWGAAAALLAWQAALFLVRRREDAPPAIDTVLRPQHYVQAAVQLSVFAYWGWYWRPVYDHAWLLAGQIVFAYAFDLLLAWSRRERYTLGFGPFPIIFSTNLFLWFRDDWFHLQFLMIAVGFLGKAFVRWERGGRRVHIFNPSAFSLGLFSVVLIATDTTALTWGEDIATTLTLAPRIYLFLFLAGLVVMYRFAITLVAGSAAIVLFGLSALYSAATGIPWFIDSEIPTAVFLGLHLLVTDPSTSPRTPLGKTVFGVLYGVGVFVLYALLGAFGAPTFLRQAALGAASQPERALDRPARRGAGVERTPRTHRRAFGPPEREPRADGGLGRLLRRHDPDRRDRRTASGRRRAVLATGMQGGAHAGLRAAAADRGVVLRGRVCLGVQRAGTSLHGWRDRRGGPGAGVELLRAGLRAPLPFRAVSTCWLGTAPTGAAEDARPAASPPGRRPEPDGHFRGGPAGASVRARLAVRL